MQGGGPRFQLGYWKIRGLAHVSRLMFEYTGTAYKDVLHEQGEGPDFSRAAWLQAKIELEKVTPFANLPYLLDSELARPLTESKAIVLHLARVLGLYGETEQERCDIENVIFAVEDVRASFTRLCYSKTFEQMRHQYVASLPQQLAPLEAWLAMRPSSSCWIAAQRISAADFFVYDLLNALQHLAPRLRDAVPKCYTHHDRVHELPSLALYRGSARFAAVSAFNNKSASFK